MISFINKLKEIKKDELDERSFYEQVLSIIKGMEDVSLTPETAEQLKIALQDIGCMRYDEWKAEKEKNGEKVEENNMEKGIEQADISTAVSFVSQLLGDYDNASRSLSYMLDGGEKYGWVQQWLKNSSKLNIPYYQVAREALMNWNGLSEGEATKILKSSSFEEIEGQVWAKGSMDHAIDSIANSLMLSNKDSQELANLVYQGGESDIKITCFKRLIELYGTKYKGVHSNEMINNIIMDTLFSVHDGWVKDNQKKFMARDKKHQHMPSELIGWKEAKADLLFIRPIFEALDMEVNEDELEQVYNNRVKDFFLDRKIVTARDLSDSITQGEHFYSALANYGEVLTTINDPDYVDQNVIPAIEQKGIGKIEDVRRNIVAQIINNPTAKDIDRLSESEKTQVEQALGQEVDTLTAERDELHQKNSIVERIMGLAKRRSDIKKEIAIEEKKKRNNIPSWDN